MCLVSVIYVELKQREDTTLYDNDVQIKKNINILHDKLNKWHFQLVFLRAAIMGEDCNLKQTESL